MIYHTENKTTIHNGQSIASVIADTLSPIDGTRITTFELVYPRYIHADFMTHRVFSRNGSSSRATPLSITVQEVRDDPVFFDYVGKNQSGMVAGEALSGKELESFKREWFALGRHVANVVDSMSKCYGIHKQTLNRALEPWSRMRLIVTSTEWENYYFLRLSADTQPEIRVLADNMLRALAKSNPKVMETHLPYVTDEEFSTFNPNLWMVSAARCARVSYKRLNGKETSIGADIELANKLFSSQHLSPFEHVAIASHGKHANFRNWQSYRNAMGF